MQIRYITLYLANSDIYKLQASKDVESDGRMPSNTEVNIGRSQDSYSRH